MRRIALAVAITALAAPCATALAHQGAADPNYRSTIRAISPQTHGLSVEVLDFEDRLQLVNRSGRTVEVDGYDGEAYARIEADGTVQVNRHSPAYYLNEVSTGSVTPPASASGDAPPQWHTLDRTGRFEWHDHRIHWMGTGLPPQVKDKGKRTKIFDWQVPVRVGGRKGDIAGTLTWVGPPSAGGPPTAAIAAFVAIVLAGGVAVVLVRRHRRAGTSSGEAW
jgi:hypothetical protein